MKTNDDLPPYRRPILPDAELLLWEKWIQIRKEEAAELARRTERKTVDLAMIRLRDTREDKERKIVLEHAQIEKKIKVRGGLWEQAPRLKQNCPCEPVYELTRTRAEKGKPPIIEHIFVPNYIEKTEMGMDGDAKCSNLKVLDTTYKKYRDERETALAKRIKKIDPFRPTSKNLMIRGERPKTPPPKIPPLPEIKITDSHDYYEDALKDVYAMRINKTVFLKRKPEQTLDHLSTMMKEKWHETCTSWTYYFNVPVNRLGRSKFFVQNLGTVSLRYCWKKIKKVIPYTPVPAHEQVFFFNKNEDVLAPGQSREIAFTFVSNKPGIYSEYWELSMCNVCFFETMAEKLTVSLIADSVEDIVITKYKSEVLKTKIHRKSLDNQMLAIINEILDNVFIVPPHIYPYKHYFLEAEIFVMKNPICFYHQTEVAKIKTLYTEMLPDQEWDLAIVSWRETMMAKEYEDRMKYYELLRISHSELIKPWYEGDDLLKEKYRAVKCLLGKLADEFDKEYDRINELFNPKIATDEEVTEEIIEISLPIDNKLQQQIRNIFFLHVSEHVATTIELCSGVLSSLDSKRWIEFDFCRL